MIFYICSLKLLEMCINKVCVLRWRWLAVHFKTETLLPGFAYPLATMPTVLWETLGCCITLHCVMRLVLIMSWPSMFLFGSAILHANNPLKNVSSEFVLLSKKAAPLRFIPATLQLVLSALMGNFANKVACFSPAFLNLFLPQHPFRSRLSSTASPYHWLTHGYYNDKVKTSAVHLDHMLGSFSKIKTAIIAVALTKTIKHKGKLMDKPLTATYVTSPSTPWNWYQHPRLRNPALVV